MQVKSENQMHINQKSMPEPRVATLDEVARILRISRGGAYAAAKRGDIPAVRIGKRILVPLAAIERLLDQTRPRSSGELPDNEGTAFATNVPDAPFQIVGRRGPTGELF